MNNSPLDISNLIERIAKLTLEDYLGDWLNRLTGVSDSTMRGYTNSVKLVVPIIGQMRLDQLHRSDIEDAYAEIQRKGCKPSTINCFGWRSE